MVDTIGGNGNAGFENGVAEHSSFKTPAGITVNKFGNIYIADRDNHAIRKIE